MKRLTGTVLSTLLFVAASAHAQSLFDNVDYKGARSHPFDVIHIAMDIRLDDAKKEVSGVVRHTIRSLSSSLSEIRLDAGETMNLKSIKVDGQTAAFRHSGDTIFLSMPRARAYNDTFVVAIDYSIVPKKGMYFIAPDSSTPSRRRQVWTQGEGEDNHYWVPMYDYPNDRATSEIRATVRSDWKVLSNGNLSATTPNNDGTVTFHWKMEKPHAGYLIMLAAGDFLITRDTVDGLPLEYWSYPDQADRVQATFSRTPAVIRFFNKMIGRQYPWNKYAQIMIADFMYGGMENTTATTLNDAYMVDQRGLLDFNPDGVISHEAGHQWYGDLITNRSWGHLWLHESYATYLEARFMGSYYGEEQYIRETYDNGLAGVNVDRDQGRDPIVSGKAITSNIYSRGARVLHMLNAVVGEEAFWRANRLFLERCGYGIAETNDLKVAFEDAVGQNLDWFFDEWLYKAGHPQYDVSYAYDKGIVNLRVRQTQKRDSLTGLFRMPVPVEVYLKNSIVRDTLWVAKEDQTFKIAASEMPRYVVFDAGDMVMKEVSFPRTDKELIAQLKGPRMIDRLLAVGELVKPKRDSIAGNATAKSTDRSQALLAQFQQDKSKFVREEIVRSSMLMDAQQGSEVVSLALKDPAVNVRRAAMDFVQLIRDDKSRVAQLRPLLADSSYSIVSSAITSIAQIDPTGLESTLRGIKKIRGRRDHVTIAWLSAVAAGKYNTLVDDVCEYTGGLYSNGARAQAFSVLAKLDTVTPGSRMCIINGLSDQSVAVQSGATSAARAHMDAEMRRLLEQRRDQVTGDERKTIEALLK